MIKLNIENGVIAVRGTNRLYPNHAQFAYKLGKGIFNTVEDDAGYQLGKALQPKGDWSDKDELLDVVYWGKQFVALFVGVVFGIAPMSGILAIIAYVAVSTITAQHFVVKYQNVDEDEVGGFWELAKEGFGAAFATFMVSWITVYSALHGFDEI